jgi:hypothetical protein
LPQGKQGLREIAVKQQTTPYDGRIKERAVNPPNLNTS